MKTFNEKDVLLLPGDCLLYRPSNLLDWIVCLKTGARISHVEIFAGSGQSYASRPGIGVDKHPFREKNLGYVRRPIMYASPVALWEEFLPFRGKKYDWLGLLGFLMLTRRGSTNRFFCSELATELYRAIGLRPFNPDIRADHFSPADLYNSPAFETVWGDER